MADKTAIEWCDATFNPWIGCTKVSPACDHCYAEADMDLRRHRVKWGAGQPRSRTSPSNWKLPLRWNRALFNECVGCGWRGEDSALAEPRRVCPTCAGNTFRAARRRVFCASLADVFDNEVDPTWRRDLFELILRTPNLDWLLLTKRIGNVPKMLEELKNIARYHEEWAQASQWLGGEPPANVWLGATICNQDEADRDIPKLLATPAAVRFLSMEPLLEPVNIAWGVGHPFGIAAGFLERGQFSPGLELLRPLDWVIAGGESGTGARPMHPDWVRSLRDQCAAAGVPFLFKQWGEWEPRYYTDPANGSRLVKMVSTRNETVLGDPLRPSTYVNMVRVGKKRAGRTLDGVEHTAFPEIRP